MNMQALMRQAQNLQKDMLKTKEEIDKMEFSATSSFKVLLQLYQKRPRRQRSFSWVILINKL